MSAGLTEGTAAPGTVVVTARFWRRGDLSLRGNGQSEVGADALALPFVGKEEKELVLDDRTAEGTAEIVVVEARLRIRRVPSDWNFVLK